MPESGRLDWLRDTRAGGVSLSARQFSVLRVRLRRVTLPTTRPAPAVTVLRKLGEPRRPVDLIAEDRAPVAFGAADVVVPMATPILAVASRICEPQFTSYTWEVPVDPRSSGPVRADVRLLAEQRCSDLPGIGRDSVVRELLYAAREGALIAPARPQDLDLRKRKAHLPPLSARGPSGLMFVGALAVGKAHTRSRA